MSAGAAFRGVTARISALFCAVGLSAAALSAVPVVSPPGVRGPACEVLAGLLPPGASALALDWPDARAPVLPCRGSGVVPAGAPLVSFCRPGDEDEPSLLVLFRGACLPPPVR